MGRGTLSKKMRQRKSQADKKDRMKRKRLSGMGRAR
jgi:hypothetical protein